MSTSSVSVDPEKVGCYELGKTEVSLRDTQFLGIGGVLYEVY